MHTRTTAALLTIALAAANTVSSANSLSTPVSLDIPASDLPSALRLLAEQADLQLVYVPNAADPAKRTTPLKGRYTTDEALRIVLADTDLTYSANDKDTVVIRRVALRTSDSNESSSRTSSSDGGLEEIVVSAQKQGDERLQDVPIPVAVLDARKLTDTGQVLLRDYYATIPGLSMSPNFLTQSRLSIRGITTGSASPTVGITIDDVPYGGSTDLTGGIYVPDINPSDLAGIEVLRGPQGTLYGANSMGGLIRYVTVDPSIDAFSGHVEAGMNRIKNGDGPGYNIGASFNVPVSDTLAIRASAYSRQDPGYIDNPVLHIDGVNKSVAEGGRLSALWRPSETTSLKLGATYQRIEADGSPEVQVAPGLKDLQQNFLADTRGYSRNVQDFSAVFRTSIGSASLVSVSGYNVNDLIATDDRSANYTQHIMALYGVTGVRYRLSSITRKFTQEIRLSAPVGERIEWSAGAFYTHEDNPAHIVMTAENVATGQEAGPWFDYTRPSKFQEYSGFANLTFHFTDRFDVQLGGRKSFNELVYEESTSGPFTARVLLAPSPVVTPRLESKTDAFTYLATPRLKLAPNLMLYARFASGYRPGGPNGVIPVSQGAPAEFVPDKTQNYELGFKGDFLDRRLLIDASIFYIDWKDVQIGLRSSSGAGYSANGAGAKSQGVELSVTARPVPSVTVTGWVTYNEAEVTQTFPANSTVYGVAGNRLPFSTRESAYLSLEKDFPLGNALSGFAGASVSYVGDRVGIFQATPVRQDLPSYTRTDLRVGIRNEAWTASAYMNNVTDERGLINGGIGYVPANVFTYIQPRTLGLNVSRSF